MVDRHGYNVQKHVDIDELKIICRLCGRQPLKCFDSSDESQSDIDVTCLLRCYVPLRYTTLLHATPRYATLLRATPRDTDGGWWMRMRCHEMWDWLDAMSTVALLTTFVLFTPNGIRQNVREQLILFAFFIFTRSARCLSIWIYVYKLFLLTCHLLSYDTFNSLSKTSFIL